MKTGAWMNLMPPVRAARDPRLRAARRRRGVVDDDGVAAEPRRDALADRH